MTQSALTNCLHRIPRSRRSCMSGGTGAGSVSQNVMRRRTFMLSLLTLCGCHSPQTERGEFAQFFVTEVRARGGRTLPV